MNAPRSITAHFERSVLAVPPLARSADGAIDRAANTKIIRHIEAGGVSILLYGGNANLYHLPLDEYEPLLAMIAETAGPETLVVPSAGPTYGLLLEHAKVIRRQRFQTVMVLPQQGVTTSAGVATGVRKFVEAAGVPALLYIKHDGYIEPADVARLCGDGLLSAIKYATVRDDTAIDPYLRQLVGVVDPKMIVSGIGEQPAIVHLRDFGLAGFTSGCGCVAPSLSQAMLAAIRRRSVSKSARSEPRKRTMNHTLIVILKRSVQLLATILFGLGATAALAIRSQGYPAETEAKVRALLPQVAVTFVK